MTLACMRMHAHSLQDRMTYNIHIRLHTFIYGVQQYKVGFYIKLQDDDDT